MLENVAPYRVGEHQHAPEIAALLGFPVTLVPHLLPVRRGLLATCYVRGDADELRSNVNETSCSVGTTTIRFGAMRYGPSAPCAVQFGK